MDPPFNRSSRQYRLLRKIIFSLHLLTQYKTLGLADIIRKARDGREDAVFASRQYANLSKQEDHLNMASLLTSTSWRAGHKK
tara:strand:- start:335 stop:580 length:246 start_codon:yes stop_codon:yes gene_type:complete